MADRRQQAMDLLTGYGWSPQAAAGIVGHGIQESGLDPTKVHDNGTGLGMFGWRDPPGTSNGRRTQLRQFAAAQGTSDTDFETQIAFLDHELRTTEKGVGDRLRGAQSATDAATIFMDFERPAGWSKDNPRGGHGWAARVTNAQGVLQGFTQGSLPDEAPASGGASVAVPLTQAEGIDQAVRENRQYEEVAGTPGARWKLLQDAASVGWLTNQLFSERSPERADPDFRMTPELLKDLQERYKLPDTYLGFFDDAHSQAQAEWYARQARERLDKEVRLNQAGFRGVAAQLLAGAADPAGLAVGIATGGLSYGLSQAANLGRVGTTVAVGLTEAAGNAASQGAVNAADPVDNDPASVLFAGGAGLVFGSLFGSLAGATRVKSELDSLAEAGASAQRKALAETSALTPPGSAGAMSNPAVRAPLRDDLGAWENLGGVIAPKTAFSGVRLDRVGALKASDIDMYRALGAVLGEDGAGNLDRSVTTVIGASEVQSRLHGSLTTQNDQVFSSAYREWADRQGLNWFQRKVGMGKFNDEVARFRRDTNPASVYDPAVVRAGAAQDALYDRLYSLAENPGLLDGSVMRPLPGFSGPKMAGRYTPRYFDWHRVNAFLDRFGTNALERLVAKAFTDRLTTAPVKEVVERFARAYVKTLSKREAGLETGLFRSLSGDDADLMEATLRNTFGMDEADAKWIANGFRQSEDSAASPRGKHRALLNDLATEDLVDKTGKLIRGVSFDSLLMSDARQIFHTYSRDMSGRIALGATKISDPDNGGFLLHGITSDAEWAKLLQIGRAAASDVGKSERVAGAEKNLVSLYKAILGQPHESDLTKVGQGIRVLQHFNFLRLMNNMGLNQVVDVANQISSVGVKAFYAGIPEFEALFRDVRTGKLKGKELNRELEAILGAGTDPLKGTFEMNWTAPDEVIGPGASAFLDRAERSLRAAGSSVSMISGMRYVNSWLARTAARAIVHKFGQYAKGATPNWNRLRALGMDEPMLRRVVDQYKAHVTTAKGDLSKIDAINLDKWTDLEARAAFEGTLYRWTRRINMENDAGTLPAFLDHRVMKAIFQFRVFMLGAFSKQTLWNLHMRDPQAIANFAIGLFTGSMTYAGLVYAQSQGMDEESRRKFIEQRLSPKAIALNGFARTGASSILPLLWDSTIGAVGTASGHKDWTVFSYSRASGQTQDLLFGNPNTGLLLNDIPKALGSAVNLIEGDGAAQTDMRNFKALLPWANALPAVGFFNAMIDRLPEEQRSN